MDAKSPRRSASFIRIRWRKASVQRLIWAGSKSCRLLRGAQGPAHQKKIPDRCRSRVGTKSGCRHNPRTGPGRRLPIRTLLNILDSSLIQAGAVIQGDCYWLTMNDGLRPIGCCSCWPWRTRHSSRNTTTPFFHTSCMLPTAVYDAIRGQVPTTRSEGDCFSQIVDEVSEILKSGEAAEPSEYKINRLVWEFVRAFPKRSLAGKSVGSCWRPLRQSGFRELST